MMRAIRKWSLVAVLVGPLAALLTACGGGGGGSSDSTAVIAMPAISTAPAAASVTTGQTASFTVVATGPGTLSYQWQRNGTDITGATSATYTTAATVAGDTGSSYTVKVSNAGGTVTSAAAALTVAAAAQSLDSQAAATDLATQANTAIAAAQAKALAPGGVNLLGALPTGVVTTTTCPDGGNYSVDLPSSLDAGTTYSFTYNNCSYLTGYVFNGSYVIAYSSFTNASNYAWTITYNLSYVGPDYNYAYHGTQSCSFNGTAYSCTYDDGVHDFNSDFTYTGGVINGSYSWTYSSYGSFTYTFDHWGDTSGRVTVTGPNGFSALIVRNSATSFTVTITNGSTYTVTISS